MKVRKVLSILLIIILIVSLTAISGCTSKPSANDNKATNEKPKVANIQFVSGNSGGSWVQMAAVIADRTNQHFDGFPITATPGGATANPLVLYKGEAQIGMSQGPFLAAARDGKPPYDKPITGIKSVCSLVPMVVYFLSAKNMPGDTVGELLKKKIPMTIGTTPKGNSSSYVMEYIFQKYGMDDIEKVKEYGGKILYADQSSLQGAWSDRHIDFYCYNTALPSSVIKEFLTIREGKLLGLEKDIIEKLVTENGFIKMTIPAGTYPGQDKDIETVGLSTVVIAREDAPEEVIYHMTKAVYEEKSYLEAAQSSFKSFDVKEMANGLVMPMHKGAEKYYKEVGLVK